MNAVDYVWRRRESVMRLSRRLEAAPEGCDPQHLGLLDSLMAEEKAMLEIVTQAEVQFAAERAGSASPAPLSRCRPLPAADGRGRPGALVIEVGRTHAGWAWEVIDQAGFVYMAGRAPEQEPAMALAWRAAKVWADAAVGEFPQVTVRHAALESVEAEA